jgi:ribosomal protein S18 acetylase RimI-like enzyme
VVAVLEVRLRQAELGDAAALAHIQVTSWRSAFRNIATDNYLDHMVSEENQVEDWKEILAATEALVFIAELEGKPVGYAWARAEEDSSVEWDAELISMHILPEHKRQGIGRRLFAATAKQLKAAGCRSMYLWVLAENQPARKFYEALGGQPAGKHQVELGDRQLTEVAYGWIDMNQLEKFG